MVTNIASNNAYIGYFTDILEVTSFHILNIMHWIDHMRILSIILLVLRNFLRRSKKWFYPEINY